MKVQHILFFFFLLSAANLSAQTNQAVAITTDSTTLRKNPAFAIDTLKRNNKPDSIPKHDPRKATRRSAILPGWGQAYNKEYWKIPIVYTAIGIPAGFYIYNQTWYKRTKFAFELAVAADTGNYKLIHPKLKKSERSTDEEYASTLRFYRNEFKKNKDYSILYFLIAWGLNVADATVFGHLKDFDVSDDLSFKFKPGYSPIAKTTGVSLVLAVRSSSEKRTQENLNLSR